MKTRSLENLRHTDAFQVVTFDRFGERFFLRPAYPEDFEELLAMYDSFEPKAIAQGIPPADDEQRRLWVREHLEEVWGVVAFSGERIVAHACLLDITPNERAELVVMVHQNYQNRQLGSQLMELLIELGEWVGYQRIWLCVDAKNSRAIHVYKKLGFEFSAPFDLELEMELNLTSAR